MLYFGGQLCAFLLFVLLPPVHVRTALRQQLIDLLIECGIDGRQRQWRRQLGHSALAAVVAAVGRRQRRALSPTQLLAAPVLGGKTRHQIPVNLKNTATLQAVDAWHTTK